jgi:hypothetical protein
MIVNKIVLGFVSQEFDTETKSFISQTFIGSDDVSYENEDGDAILGRDLPDEFREHLVTNIKQPNDNAEEKLNEIRSVIEESKSSPIPDQRRLDLILDILNTNC